MTETERSRAVGLALGRILRLGARPEQPGDIEEYERCRRVILGAIGTEAAYVDRRTNYARDRLRGAQGD
jgi:hypothetical protein